MDCHSMGWRVGSGRISFFAIKADSSQQWVVNVGSAATFHFGLSGWFAAGKQASLPD